MREHTAPWKCMYAKEDKSKCKPGKKPKSNQEYFEILCLCILQSGLNWKMVRKNWSKIKKGFYNFNINHLSKITSKKLFSREGVFKNERKVNAIIANAKEFHKILKEFGSFSRYLESLKKPKDRDAIRELRKRFKHVGEYTAEYYLHSIRY
jgi:DNA-3-methyladenine glycosylase I